MSDVDNSTQGMLEAVRAEKRKLQQRLAQLDEREKTILVWMEEEAPKGNRPRIVLKPRLPSFLRDTILDGKPRSNVELAEMAKARGIVSEDVDLRSINAVVLGFMKAGLVQRRRG